MQRSEKLNLTRFYCSNMLVICQ